LQSMTAGGRKELSPIDLLRAYRELGTPAPQADALTVIKNLKDLGLVGGPTAPGGQSPIAEVGTLLTQMMQMDAMNRSQQRSSACGAPGRHAAPPPPPAPTPMRAMVPGLGLGAPGRPHPPLPAGFASARAGAPPPPAPPAPAQAPARAPTAADVARMLADPA